MLLFLIRICSVGTKANNCKISSTLDKEYEYEYRSWNVLAHADLLVVYWLSCWILWSVVTLLWQGTCNCSALPDYQAGDKERHLYTVCKHAAIYMPWPGFEPGLLRPQRNVLTTIRSRLSEVGGFVCGSSVLIVYFRYYSYSSFVLSLGRCHQAMLLRWTYWGHLLDEARVITWKRQKHHQR